MNSRDIILLEKEEARERESGNVKVKQTWGLIGFGFFLFNLNRVGWIKWFLFIFK